MSERTKHHSKKSAKSQQRLQREIHLIENDIVSAFLSMQVGSSDIPAGGHIVIAVISCNSTRIHIYCSGI